MPPIPKTPPTYFSGRVHSVNFSDKSKAFYILRMSLDAECITDDVTDARGLVAVTGDIPGVHIAVGVWFGFEGVWHQHPKHGKQVKVTRAPVLKNGWDDDTCVKVLVSQGIGSALVAKVRESLKGDLVTALSDPERLKTVPGVNTMMAEHIIHKWKMARSLFLTLDFLGDLGIPQGKVRQVWEIFGDRAQDVLSTDPWSLLDLEGLTFADCDTVARRLGLDCSPSNINRVKGAVVHASKTGKGQGHLYLLSGELLAVVRPLDPLMTDQDIAVGLGSLVEEKRVVVDRTFPGVTAIYDPWSYETEDGSARILCERLVTAAIPPDRAAQYAKAILGVDEPGITLREAGERHLASVGSSLGVTLSPSQAEAVLNCLTESVSVITGLPGSGKTTSLRMALGLLHEAGMVPLVVAPTGIAAKRVASVTGVKSSTIHRAFKATGIESESGRESTYAGVVGDRGDTSVSDGSEEAWGYGPGNPHPAEVVVVDECFHYKQPVLTENGWEYIGKIVEQQLPVRVWSRNPSTGVLELKTIVRYLKRPSPKGLLRVSVGQSHSMRSAKIIRCTPDHKIMTPSGYVRAGDLKVGDPVVVRGVSLTRSQMSVPETQSDTTVAPVSSVTKYEPKRTYPSVYDLEVQDHHNYVAGNVVVSNCSMVDQAVLYRVLTCTRPDCRLVFVGDSAQLPSVGAGNVLRDIIASGRFPTVSFTEIFRQADTSPIVTAAHDTFHGIVPAAPLMSDFSLIPYSNDDDVLKTVLGLSERLYNDRKNFQVLSPRHAGTLGVTNLNNRLRALLNPAQHGLHEVSLGGDVLREGDRVIVSKNDYKLGVFNGDVAKVNFIDKNAKEIELKIHGPPVLMVRIPIAKARNLLRLAYAVTVHRMQGLECDVVVMPLVEGFAHQLQRNLFYTAITRAKKKVLLVGSHRAMERAVNNNREDARNTLFAARLKKDIAQ